MTSDRSDSPPERWSRARNGQARRVVHLLDADRELARRVAATERELARSCLVAPVLRVAAGRWRPDPGSGRRPVAYLLLEGTVLRSCRVGDRWSTELLGREDVLRPWEEVDGVDVESEWQALECLQVAILDRRLVSIAARWPDIFDELLSRSVRRSRDLAMLRSVCGIRRLNVRLLVLLRLLAGRWGHVSPQGVHVGVRLTHETIARLAGAQRPSVSTALARLRREGLLKTEGREFVLPAPLPAEVQEAMTTLA